MHKLGRFYYTSRGFDLLASLDKCNQVLTWNKMLKQLAFLIISTTPSMQILHKFQATLYG